MSVLTLLVLLDIIAYTVGANYLDCYESFDGSDYTGTVNVTESGVACQRWDASTHDNFAFPELHDQENYCRNPDLSMRPWCYSVLGDWEYCNVSKCDNTVNNECYMADRGTDYRGKVNVTENGTACMPWSDIHPHKHRFTFLSKENNYCRNPDNEPRTWCYTTDPGIRFEFCDVKPCEITSEFCYSLHKAYLYSGKVNVTVTGYPCQRWDAQFPHKHAYSSYGRHENYCRTPDGSPFPWCYSLNPTRRWEQCKLAPCDKYTRYGCQGDWDKFDGNCYKFERKVITWDDAAATCRNLGAEVTQVLNETEQQFIASMISSDLCFNTYDDSRCSNWAAKGECWKNPLFMIKKCRKSCDHAVFCNHACENNIHENSTKCEIWQEDGECANNPLWMFSRCSHTCSVCSEVENARFWLGAKYSLLTDYNASYGPFSSNFSNFDYSSKTPRTLDCLSMKVSNGKWQWQKCKDKLAGFTCKKPMSYFIEKQYCHMEFEGICYTLNLEPKSFEDAKMHCMASHSDRHLANISNVDLETYISSRLHTKFSQYWAVTSLVDTQQNVTNGRSCVTIEKPRNSFANRTFLEANCSDLYPFICAEKLASSGITSTKRTTKRVSMSITSVRPTFTKDEKTTLSSAIPVKISSSSAVTMRTPTTEITTASTEVTTDVIQNTSCGYEWSKFKDTCFKKLFHPWPWSRGRSHCNAIFGDLATIHSQEQYAFILRLFVNRENNQYLWVGLHSNNSFSRWTDGSVVNFTPGISDSDSMVTSPTCLAISYKGDWVKKSCSNWYPVLCMKHSKGACGKVPSLEHAKISDGTSHVGSVRTLTCAPGYTAGQGSRHIKCQENFQWSSPVFKCYSNCYTPSTDYYGNYNVTESGKPCQNWNKSTPHRHRYGSWPNAVENYCRTYNHNRPWCYTVYKEHRWENCDVPICEDKESNMEKTTTTKSVINTSKGEYITGVTGNNNGGSGYTPASSLGKSGGQTRSENTKTILSPDTVFLIAGMGIALLLLAAIFSFTFVLFRKSKRQTSYKENENLGFENAMYMQSGIDTYNLNGVTGGHSVDGTDKF